MDKVMEFCSAIETVQKLAGEIFSGNPWISATQYHRKVQVDSIRNLEQVEGEAKVEPFNHGKEFSWRASKVFDGTEFYVLLTQADYEAAKQAS